MKPDALNVKVVNSIINRIILLRSEAPRLSDLPRRGQCGAGHRALQRAILNDKTNAARR